MSELLARLRRRYWQGRARGCMGEFLASDRAATGIDWRQGRFLVVDIESTGLDPKRDQIISIGWLQVERASIDLSSAGHQLVRGSLGVGRSATIHQITDGDRGAGADLRSVMDRLLTQLSGRVLVVHHAALDVALLDTASRRLYGVPLLTPLIDTLALEGTRLAIQGRDGGGGALRLGACRARYGLPEYPVHDALADALATAELLLAQLHHLAGRAALKVRAVAGYRAA